MPRSELDSEVSLTQGAPTAFFSYCRNDSDFALRLAGDLKAAGANVWLDQLDIIPGQRWDRAVEDALTNCPSMLVILTPASVNSTNVMDEVSFALEEQKSVIPIVYQQCVIPFRLRRVEHVDFTKDYARGLKELLKTLVPQQGEKTSAPPVVQAGPSPVNLSHQDESGLAVQRQVEKARPQAITEPAVPARVEAESVVAASS